MPQSELRKPLGIATKKYFKEGVKFVWLRCEKCECEFEITESAAKSQYPPELCFDCWGAGGFK